MFGNDMTQDDLRRLYDANVVDETGDKIGGVGQIYLDDQTDRPTWATVKTGLFGTKETFVPLQDASLDGDDPATVLADHDPVAVLDRVGAVGPDALARARRWFVSFGCCGVEDPYHDLVDLGLV